MGTGIESSSNAVVTAAYVDGGSSNNGSSIHTSPFKKHGASIGLPVTPSASSAASSSSAYSPTHPSPNSTKDAMTPRSAKQHEPCYSAAFETNNNEPKDSPFFANWDSRHTGDEVIQAEDEGRIKQRGVKADSEDALVIHQDAETQSYDIFGHTVAPEPGVHYSLASASATSISTPLFTSATRSQLVVTPSTMSSSADSLTPSIRALSVTPSPPQGWPAPLSPLPTTALAPSAPKLGTLPTPVMSPHTSLPSTPSVFLQYRKLGPPRAAEATDGAGETSTIRSLLDLQGKLPLPGQWEDEDVTISSAMLNSTTRSESVDSISSVLNDLGHDTTPPNENTEESQESSLPPYAGSAFIHDVNAPPLQAFPTQIQVERALPLPPAKHPSDPPLISSLRRPDLMHLAGEGSGSQRPVSPFSPTLALFPDNARQSSIHAPYDDQQSRANTPDPDQDLINFDSDDDVSTLPETYDQYAQYKDHEGGSTYFNQNPCRPDYSHHGSDTASSSSREEEEEDYSSHALYTTLSTSESPYVRRAWEGSKVILVPASHTLPNAYLTSSKQYNANTSLDNPEEWERFTAVHALRQEATSPDHYAGYGETSDGYRLHARLDSQNKQVQISLRQELDSSTSSGGPAPPTFFNEFGMSVHPGSQPLSRHAVSSSTASTQSGAIPPHLLISSPTTSVDSGNFPNTPPLSQEMSATVPSSSSLSTGSTPRIAQAVAFPSIEQNKQSQQISRNPLSPTRRLNIVHEKIIYRKRRITSTVSSSAPSTMPSPPPMSRNDSAMSSASTAAAAQVNSVQQAADRLSKLSTPSMQSISSLASVSTNNGKSVKKKDSKVRLRVPKWLGGRNRDSVSGPLTDLKQTESAPTTPLMPPVARTPTVQEEIQLVIEKVRVIQVDSYIVEWPGEETVVSPRDFRKSLPLSARQSQQNMAARMHRKSSQPLAAPTSSQVQDATVKQRRSFQYPSFSTTFAEDANEDGETIASVGMASRHNSNTSRSSRVSKRSSSAIRMKHSSQTSSSHAVSRDFSSDIAYLLDPPKYLEHFAGLFEQSLKLIIRSSRDFAERFYYIRGQENDAVARLKEEVLNEVWQYFADEDAIHGLRHHLLDIFENATMAFAHDYVYAKTIKPSYNQIEVEFGNLINVYRVHTISMADFGISSGHFSEGTFAPVVDILSELCGCGASRQELWEKMPPQSYKRLVQLISQTTDSASTVIALLEAKTPLDTISQLRKVIDELVKATSSSDTGHEESHSRLATDDLIPLLSWALVKANAKTLPSLLFYSKMFRLSSQTQADSEWTIVQFEAAMAFLSTDPLRLQKASAVSSPALESHSMSPVQPVFLRTVSEDSLGLPGRSRRNSIQSLPPDSARVSSRSPSQQIHLASYHKRTLSSLPSTRMALYQAAGRPSSIVSAVTTEEDEDNAEMGPPAPPRKDSLGGSADGHDLLSASILGTGRDRSTSPPIHRPVAVRPPRRPFHMAHDQTTASQPSRIPLGRSQTTPLNGVTRPSSLIGNRASVELHRTGSDASRRGSVDWWGPLRYAVAGGPTSPPVGSEGTMSSRPDSPASPAVKSADRHGSARSSFDLERSTSDIGWVEWGRRRLSSMTSSTSLVDAAEGGRSVADQIAEKIAASAARGNAIPIANRSRRKSESAASALSPTQFEDAASEIQAIAAPSQGELASSTLSNVGARSLTSAGSRPRSTLSLSSTSSLDTDASLGRSANTASAPVAGRSQFRNSIAGPPSSYSSQSSNLSRSRRFRKELRSANLGPSMALPQLQLDTASASALNTSSGSSSSSYSHRPSSLHLDTAFNSGLGSSGFYSSYSLSHSTSRLGTTPFSPIQEVAPAIQTYSSSPEHVLGITAPPSTLVDESVPPTPRGFASATNQPWSQPTT